MTSMTHHLPSDVPGGCGFSVRTVYSCDACGFEVDSLEKITEHLAEHNPDDTKSVDHNGRLDPFMPHQQGNVSSPPCSPVKLETHSGNVLDQQSVGQAGSQTVPAKPLVCNVCGRIYKYLRCFKRHIEREHKSLAQSNSGEAVTGLQHRGVNTAFKSPSDNINSSDSQQQLEIRYTDNPLSNTDYFELQEEVTDILDEVFTSASDEVHSQAALYCCPDCPQQFQSYRSFCLHVADKHTGWNLVCKWCGRLFQESDKLRSHIIGDHDQMIDECDTGSVNPVLNPHHCIICSLRYRSKKELAKHIKSHNNLMPAFACSMCSGRYASKSGLNYHIRRAHSTDCPYVCELCGDRFATAGARSEHAKEHTGDLCTVCGVRLRQVTSSGKDDDTTMCVVCYLEQLSSKNGVQIVEEVEDPATEKLPASPLPLKYSCTVCGMQFAWRSSLLRHERQYASDSLHHHVRENNHFQCTFCSRVFHHAKGIRRHIRSHIDRRASSQPLPFSCNLCGQSFLWKGSLLRHLRTSHPASSTHHIPVVTSSLHVVSMDQCVSSVMSVKANSSQVCDLCGSQFESLVTLNAHRRDYHGVVTQPAENGSTSSKNKMAIPCPECNAVFFWGSNMRRHMREEHQGDKKSRKNAGERRLQCTRCGRRFTRLCYLRTHLQAHVKAERNGGQLQSLLCSECGRMMSDARQLRFHMLRHSGDRPHKCNQCNKSFYVRAHLNSHVSIVHRGNRFVCDQCGHEANSKSALRAHYRSAHPSLEDEPGFPCPVCSRRYWTPAALRRHAEAHDPTRSAKRKAMCAICSMLFRHVFNLGHHIKTTHADVDLPTPFACATCHEQFDSGQAFKAHYRSKHRNR